MTRSATPLRLEWIDPAVCSPDYRLKIIGHLPFFRHLTPAAIAEINRLFRDREVLAGDSVYFEGDPAERLYLVALGKIKLIRHAGSGGDILLDILHGGDYFGSLSLAGGNTYAESAQAQTDGCILSITTGEFLTILARHPDVTSKVLQAVERRLKDSQEIVEQLSTYSVEQRVAAALLRLAGKLGEQHGAEVLIQLPFSRQDLAGMTGTTLETVSRVMSRFADQGIIKTGRKWVTLLDRERLQDMVA